MARGGIKRFQIETSSRFSQVSYCRIKVIDFKRKTWTVFRRFPVFASHVPDREGGRTKVIFYKRFISASECAARFQFERPFVERPCPFDVGDRITRESDFNNLHRVLISRWSLQLPSLRPLPGRMRPGLVTWTLLTASFLALHSCLRVERPAGR